MNRVFLTVAVASWLCAAGEECLFANPSHEVPNKALDVRPEFGGQGLQKSLAEGCAKLQPSMTDLAEAVKEKQWKRVKAKQVTDALELLLKLEREAEQLKVLGEPAGVDFEFRVSEMREMIEKTMVESRSVREVSKQLEPIFNKMVTDAKKKAQNLPRIEQLVKQQKYEQAETELYDVVDPLQAAIPWFEGNAVGKHLDPFLNLLQEVQPKMVQIRRQQAQDKLTKAIAELSPNYDELLNRVAAAANEIQAGGKAQFDGEPLSGPELVAKFGEQWQAAHLATIQCVGLHWASGKAAGVAGGEELTQFLDRHKNFSLQMTVNLAKLVESDAARSTGSDARQLYFQYLDVLAPLVSLSSEPKFMATLDPPLKALAAKSPEFPAYVAGYDRVMGDLLRWRQRTAVALAQVHQGSYRPIDEQCSETLRPRDRETGLIEEGHNDLVLRMKSSVPKVMPQVAELVGKQVTLPSWVGLPTAKSSAIGQLQRRCCARISLPEKLTEERAALEADLLVTPETPPLSLQAATALATSKRGDLAAVGGTVRGVYLESMVNRYAMLSKGGRNLLPLRPLDAVGVGPDPLPHVLLRFDVEPAWLQHPYFFVQLP